MNNLKPKLIPVLIALVLLLVLIGIILISVTSKTPTPGLTQPTPTKQPKKVLPPVIEQVPIAPIEQGGGIDENSEIIRSSKAEIQKLYQYLPYSLDFVSSTGVEISIILPEQSLQTNSWTLTAQIFGINYNTSPEQPDYESMRKSFIEASALIFAWVYKNNANPERILFNWGSDALIQEQAETWLSQN